jgi:NAD(P)-dependent dehydrogenase (short-subunit alcohol dehydrogenase family)
MDKKVVLLTGGNSGIGFQLVVSLLKENYRVAALDLKVDRLQELEADCGNTFQFIQCDLTADQEVRRAVQAVLASWGRIDILVNNACLAVFQPFEERSEQQTRNEFEVNYFGALRLIRAVLPGMKTQGGGIIHNVSSGVGITGFPGLAGYASTKGAIEALTRTLALELASYNITVNLIHPPLTDTPSAAPLGVPEEIMADPADVGRKLARKIGSRIDLITPDFQTRLGLFANRLFPIGMGQFLARMTENARQNQRGDGAD